MQENTEQGKAQAEGWCRAMEGVPGLRSERPRSRSETNPDPVQGVPTYRIYTLTPTYIDLFLYLHMCIKNHELILTSIIQPYATGSYFLLICNFFL